jgi:uncharacterized protein Veg
MKWRQETKFIDPIEEIDRNITLQETYSASFLVMKENQHDHLNR